MAINLPQAIANEAWRLHPSAMASKVDAKYVRYRHIEHLSNLIAPAILKGGARIIVELPPRHGKSWLISKWTPTWFLSWYPNKRVILTSYEADFAASWGRMVRNQISDSDGKFGITISDDSSAADRWETKEGGGMVTAGVNGPITGRGGDLMLVDDYCKNAEDADSPTKRKKTIEWWQSTFYTRREPNASIIVLSTRWHEGDLIGYLLGPENETRDSWTRIRLPALAEQNDVLGRMVGEALCPERYDEEDLDDIKRNVGTRTWTALYQQRPAPEQGAIVKREWWRLYNLDGEDGIDKLPVEFDIIVQAWDLTFTDSKTSDYVVGVVWAKAGANCYLLDMVRDRMSFTETISAIEKLSRKWPQTEAKYVEQAANGFALIDMLKSKISGLIPVKPLGSKIARANAVSPRVEAGNVWLPHPSVAPWVTDIIEEWASFPAGEHDDIVDAMCHGLIKLGGIPDSDWLPVSITGVNKFGDMSGR